MSRRTTSLLPLRHDRTRGTPGSWRSFVCLLASVARGSAISRSDKAEGGALRIDAVECEFAAGDFHRPIDHFATAGFDRADGPVAVVDRSEKHTPELQSQMRISYAVYCLKK